MRESYGEGLASHPGPESCGKPARDTRSVDRGTRRPCIELRNQHIQGVEGVRLLEDNICRGDRRETRQDPARSETSGTRGNSVHGNREIPQLSRLDRSRDRLGKEEDHKPSVNGSGKSDGLIVPMKLPNKGGGDPPAEAMEGRGPTKGNTTQPAAGCTQRQVPASTGSDRVRRVRTALTLASTPSTRGKSRMQESCTYGSVRGVARKGDPYRDNVWAGPRMAPFVTDVRTSDKLATARSIVPSLVARRHPIRDADEQTVP